MRKFLCEDYDDKWLLVELLIPGNIKRINLDSLVNQLPSLPKSSNFAAIVGLLRVSFLVVTF